MSVLEKDGRTVREHLQDALNMARNPERVAELEAQLYSDPFPEPLDYLWKAFTRLAGRRGSNGFGPNPISYEAIGFYSRNILPLDDWEIEIIELLDNLSLSAAVSSKPSRNEDSDPS